MPDEKQILADFLHMERIGNDKMEGANYPSILAVLSEKYEVSADKIRLIVLDNVYTDPN